MITQTFSLYPDSIQHEDIIEDWYIVCASWAENSGKVHAVSVLDDKKRFKKNPRDDYHVVKTLHDLMSKAESVVAHNGDKFDWKKFNARVIYHGLSPLPPITKIDTLKLARKHFNFTSNRLDYLGEFLGVGRKINTSKGLWNKTRLGIESAVKEMVKYNKQDVLLLRDVYKKMEPHVSLPLSSIDCCPKCKSKKIQKRGFTKTKLNRYQRYQCQDCGSWSKSRIAIKEEKPTVI